VWPEAGFAIFVRVAGLRSASPRPSGDRQFATCEPTVFDASMTAVRSTLRNRLGIDQPLGTPQYSRGTGRKSYSKVQVCSGSKRVTPP
jgi:hypothetical protein